MGLEGNDHRQGFDTKKPVFQVNYDRTTDGAAVFQDIQTGKRAITATGIHQKVDNQASAGK